MYKSPYFPHLILGTTTLIAAINYSVAKELMPNYISPQALIMLRTLGAGIFFSIIYIFSTKQKISRPDLTRLFAASAFGIAANQLLFMEGLNKTTPINAALMMTSSPILVFIISSYFLKDKITWLKILGIGLAASGAISLLLHSAKIEAHQIMLGDIYVLLNACCWALFLVIIKPLVMKYKTTTLMPYLFLTGMFLVLPFGAEELINTAFISFTIHAWWALLFVMICSTYVAYYLNIHALKYVHPSIAGVYIYLQPPLTSFFAWWMNKDQWTMEKIFFSVLILLGVYLVSMKRNS